MVWANIMTELFFSADPFDEAKLREIIAHVKEDSLENFIFEEKIKAIWSIGMRNNFLNNICKCAL